MPLVIFSFLNFKSTFIWNLLESQGYKDILSNEKIYSNLKPMALFILDEMQQKHSFMSDSSQPHGLQPTRLLHPWDFLGKSTGVGCHCLLWFFLRRGQKKTAFFLKMLGSCPLSSFILSAPGSGIPVLPGFKPGTAAMGCWVTWVIGLQPTS